jgi:hypothetical protein
MSIQVNNNYNQLNIITNGVLDVYNLDTIKSVSRAVDASGNNYISLNFIANDKNNSVRIPLVQVIDPMTWTNDTDGANQAIEDISKWMDQPVQADITSPLDQQDSSESVSTVLSYQQANIQVTPMLLDISGSTGNLTSYPVNSLLSISFASRGTAGSDISVDGGSTYARLFPGETLNLDANGIMNYYDPALIYWDASAAGAKLLIALNHI